MAQLLSTNVSGTLAVTQNVNVAGNLIVSGYNVLNEIFQADNLARVSANSGATQSAVALNFVNTATVSVSVTSGGTGVANIAFTSTAGGSGTVTSVGTGTGLSGGPITSSGTISANIASTTVVGVTKLIDSVTTNDSSNAATGAAVKSAFDQATLAYGQANTANTTAVSAFGAANSAANTVRVSANSGSIQSAVGLNFNNTAYIQVSVGAGTTGNANVTLSLTENVTVTSLNVTNIQNSSSNVFVKKSRFIVSNPIDVGTAGVTDYATIHAGDPVNGWYSSASGYGYSGNLNGTLSAFSVFNTNTGTNSAVSAEMYAGTAGGSQYLTFGATKVDGGFISSGNNLGIGFSEFGAANGSLTIWDYGSNLVNGGELVRIEGVDGKAKFWYGINAYSDSTITGNVVIQANGSRDALRITQLGSGNAFVVEDSTNPDNTPFIVDTTGNVGIGISNPTIKLHVVGDANITSNLTVSTLNVTNIQNSSSNVFLRNSRLIAANSGNQTTTLDQTYSIFHIGDPGDSLYRYTNAGGYAINRTANGSIYAFDGYNTSNGSAADISTWLQVGRGSSIKYVSLGVNNSQGYVYGSRDFNIGYNVDNLGANLRIQGGQGGSLINVLFMAANGLSSFDYPVIIQSVNVAPAIANAANTVRVAANSGSIQSAVGLNFNNTATIRVNVGTGTTGNANISFDYIGSVTGGGGGGINNFPVSANSGSTVTANGLNFVNSSSILVSVAAGTTGNASVTLTATNISDDLKILSGVNNESNVRILSDNRLTEWSHLENGNIFNLVNETTSQGVFAGNNGNSIYVVGQAQDNVTQYNLSTAWNVATASFASNLSISAQETTAVDLFFKNDGSVLYVLGDAGNDITYYTLGTPWSVGGTVTLGGTYSVSAQTSAPRGMFISNDGAKMLVSSATQVFQYTVATPWDLTTASYDNKSYTQVEDTAGQAVSMNPSGTRMLILGNSNDYIYEYALSTANDVTTAAYTGRKKSSNRRQDSISGEDSATGMYVAYSNNRMYIVGTTVDQIIEYNLDKGLTIETNTLSVEGAGHFTDSLFVGGDIRVASSIQIDNTLTTTGAATFDAAATFNGTFTFAGSSGTFGSSTANATYSLGTGATVASRIKTIDIGTGGVAGSVTNITVGPTGVAANVNINANTVTISNTVNIGGQLVVSGLNIVNEIALADNLTRVAANSGSIQSAVAINFINTSSVTVSVTPGETGYANVAFSSSATGGVTSVATGIGLTGGPITSTGTISANIASTTVQGVTKLIDSISSTDAANAATAAAVRTAYNQATAAYAAANTGLNKTQVSANSGSIQSNVAINFQNTSSIRVSVSAGTAGNADIELSNYISVGTVASGATITPVKTGPHSHYTVTALAVASTINPPAINTGSDGDRLTLRIKDNGTGRGLTWNTSAGAYRAVGVTLPTTTVASKVLYIGSIYNSQDNFWDVVAYVVQA